MAIQARVLVVEDNETNMMIFRDILTAAGYTVLEATRANDVFRLTVEERPDLILMDIQLPGMDGFEIVERLKKDPALRSIPIVALTAHAMATHRQKAMEAGCSGYITKPIRAKEFREQVHSFLAKESEGHG